MRNCPASPTARWAVGIGPSRNGLSSRGADVTGSGTHHTYTSAPDGPRRSRIKDGVATTWVYDSIYRLTAQQESGRAASFVYDASGNITVKHHQGSDPTSMTYDAANRLVTTQQGATLGTYTFDANGNMTGEVAGGLRITFVYDQENRQLQEIRSSGSRHTYTYEPDGLRRSAFHAGTSDVVTFIWDGDDLLNERIEGANAARYAVLDGEVLSEKRGASRYRFVPDPLGSVRAVLDTSGSIVATRDYYPYGEVAAQSGSMTAIQFVGALGYFTDTTNRVYVRARHYRPDLGRWVTKDPIGLVRGRIELYLYGMGRPTGLTDPSGLDEMWSICGFARHIGMDEGHLGGVICSGGKKIPCCWPQNQPGFGRHVLGCLCTCVIEHEKTHFDDITCPPHEFCRPSFRFKFRWRWWLTPDIEECTGYATEAACLLRTAGACCLGQDMLWTLGCLAELNTLLCDRCRKGRAHCRKAGMPFAPDRDCRSLCPGVY